MKKNTVKRLVLCGAGCLLLLLLSAWYAVVWNESRLVAPMDFATYVFRLRDLPMLVLLSLLILYVCCLVALVVSAVLRSRRRSASDRTTRSIRPRLGLLGLLGFGGFWTYSWNGTIFPFLFFLFFGFFGFFFEGKLSNTFMDERYRENKLRAQLTAQRVSLTVIFLAIVLLGCGSLMRHLEYTLISLLIVISLALALWLFLSEYLLYRYDHNEPAEEIEG